MNGVLLVLIIVVIAAIGLAVYSSSKASGRRNAASLMTASTCSGLSPTNLFCRAVRASARRFTVSSLTLGSALRERSAA